MITLTALYLAAASPIWYYGQIACPFYCTKSWVCDYTPCKDPEKARRQCAVKTCPSYPVQR